MMTGAPRGLTSVHQGFMPEIEIIDAENARGIWAMFDLVRFPEGPIKEFSGYGHYHETYRKEGGAWKIAVIRLTCLRVDYTYA
jgi:SnoaL-like domain